MTSTKSIKTEPAQVPPGLKSLIDHCKQFYPDQPNPLQVTTVVKYWLGGQDPLDYISMYHNNGDPSKNIPPHWHYISFGLSDLHGDGRVHIRENAEETNFSGMGFELTFRLLKSEAESHETVKISRPPTWPANLLQNIARYCFQTGNRLCVGDNIPWRKNFDSSGQLQSQIQNILVAQDMQLGSMETPFGIVDFCQIVGVTESELKQASRWNGRGVLNYLQQDSLTGGEYLVTNMNRTLSVFELFPETLQNLQDDLEKQGSDLAGINADFIFREMKHERVIKQEMDSDELKARLSEETRTVLLETSEVKNEGSSFPQSMSLSSSSLHNSCPLDYQPEVPNCVSLDGIEITLAPYAAEFLLLAIKDRIRHGRHFTFKAQHLALTLVAETVTGAAVSKDAPYGVLGYWVQVLIPEDLVPRMMEAFQNVNFNDEITRQKQLEFEWIDKKLKIIVDNPIQVPIV